MTKQWTHTQVAMQCVRNEIHNSYKYVELLPKLAQLFEWPHRCVDSKSEGECSRLLTTLCALLFNVAFELHQFNINIPIKNFEFACVHLSATLVIFHRSLSIVISYGERNQAARKSKCETITWPLLLRSVFLKKIFGFSFVSVQCWTCIDPLFILCFMNIHNLGER